MMRRERSAPNGLRSPWLIAGRGACAAAGLLVAACGLGGAPSGGSSNLPAVPLVPWTPIAERDPCDDITASTVLRHDDGDAIDPWAVASGTRVWLYHAVRSADRSFIVRAESADGVDFPAAASATVLEAESAWEGGRVSAPSVLADGGQYRLYYVGGDGGGIGTATSVDGLHWRRRAAPVLEPTLTWEQEGGIGHASAVRTDGTIWLFYEARAGQVVGLARSTDGERFTRVDGDPSTAEVDPVLLAPAGGQVATPHVEGEQTATGRWRYRLWFAVEKAGAAGAIGVAGAFEPWAWQLYADNPVLEAGGLKPRAPARLDVADAAYLYSSQLDRPQGSRRVIALAYWGLPGPCVAPGRQQRQ